MISYLKLPFGFDAARLLAEIEDIAAPWQAHFNTGVYEGNWNGLPLRAPGGATTNLLAEKPGGNEDFEDTPLLEQCPYIRQVLATFQCEQTSVRLLRLERGAIVHEHTDPGLNFEEGEVRLHIPVRTHELVEFYLDGDRLPMQAGECWYINAALPHRLANPSPADRIHLVVDCVVNDWLKALFTQTELPIKKVIDTSGAGRERRAQMIAELRRAADPHRRRMADELEREDNGQSGSSETAAADVLATIAGFIRSVGIGVSFRDLPEPGFLPGIAIERGAIIIDTGQLKYPGDLLHEAGHIAVVPLAERGTLDAGSLGKRPQNAAEEMMAMAWSYAAARHLGLDPRVVFHADGYKGGADSLLESFGSDMPLGVPMLHYTGMAQQKNHPHAKPDVLPYPAMLRWTRE